MAVDVPFGPASAGARCPGCQRLLDASALQEGERFKCAKCKKLLTYGPHLHDPGSVTTWQSVRSGALLLVVGSTVWCLTLGVAFGSRTGRWGLGFGGPLAVWLIAVGCIVLAAATTQNMGVLAGVGAAMNGLALFFVERLGRHVGYPVGAWHRRLAHFSLWAPGLVVVGLAVLAGALVVQGRRRAV